MTEEELALLNRIQRTLILRWWIFSIMLLAFIIGAVASMYNTNVLFRVETLLRQTDVRSINNAAKVDAAIAQQIIYQQQIAQSMDFLAKKNPKINVPKVVVRPPTLNAVNGVPLTEVELTRPKDSKITPTPSPKAVQTKKKKLKPRPTPGPFQRLFQPRSTR